MKKLFKYQLFIFILLSLTTLHAGDTLNDLSNYNHRYWLELGLGNAFWHRESGEKNSGLLMYSSLNYSINNYKFKTYALLASEVNLNLFMPTDEYLLMGCMFGRKTKGKHIYLSANAGLGIMYAKERGDRYLSNGEFLVYEYEKIDYTALNIPLEINAAITENYIGLDIKLYAFINQKRPLYGVIVSFYLGNFKN